MTVQEVLEADWHVSEIDITVRKKESSKYIMEYCIGRDVKPVRSQRFWYESKLGDIYKTSGMSVLYMKRIIQFRQLEKKPQGKEMCVGVLDKEIPKELLGLTVEQMLPYCLGHADGLHGYRFECYVDSWNGIPGEYEQLSIDLQEVMP